jgi:hypothetical protein
MLLPPVDETLRDEAIAYYQTASGAFKYRKLLAGLLTPNKPTAPAPMPFRVSS